MATILPSMRTMIAAVSLAFLLSSSALAETQCLDSDQLLQQSIACSQRDGKASLGYEGACRVLVCTGRTSSDAGLISPSAAALKGSGRIATLAKKAIAGDNDASYALGMMYYLGRGGVPKDDIQAFVWIVLASGRGKRLPNEAELQRYFDAHLTDSERRAATLLLQRTLAKAKQPAAAASSSTGPDAADLRNAQRKVDVGAILNGITQYLVDNGGSYPVSLPIQPTAICRTHVAVCGDLVDLSALNLYLIRIPVDPSALAGSNATGYAIRIDDEGRVTISAPLAEKGQQISARQ